MIDFPSSAAFGKKITQVQLKKHGFKSRLAGMVKSLVWAYKLAPATVNLAATEAVSEVEVLDLSLRGEGGKKRCLASVVSSVGSTTVIAEPSPRRRDLSARRLFARFLNTSAVKFGIILGMEKEWRRKVAQASRRLNDLWLGKGM